MRRVILCIVLLLSVGATLGAGKARKVRGEERKFPYLRFPYGDISCNDRCPLTKSRLNRKMNPVWVNDRPVGFC